MARGPRIGRTDAVDSDVIEHSTFIAILRWANKPTWLVPVIIPQGPSSALRFLESRKAII